MLELMPLCLLLISGIGTVVLNQVWLGKFGVIGAILAFVPGLFCQSKNITFDWFTFVDITFDFSFKFGPIEILLCLVINLILVCLYYTTSAISFEKDAQRKFGALNIFIFFMCIAILSNNIIQFYIAIEALGLISALLVSIEKNAEMHATKVFLFNKFASTLFLIGITLLAKETKSFEMSEICSKAFSPLPACLLIIACFCKGAQMPFSNWLIDAVKANIFASILIHAGTIVAIGVIFITKFYFIFEQFLILRQIMIVLGILTALWGGSCALAHNNIKKIIACLTISSSGILFTLCGFKAYATTLLYFVCHAFFKATLFLAFAYLISAMSGEKSMNRMGGIARIAPKVTNVIWVSFLFAAGFPFLPGFFPKIALSEVIKTADSKILLIAIIVASLLNVMAIFRMTLKSLYGESRSDELTFYRASKSNEYNFFPFWGLSLLALAFSLIVWNLFVWGKLSFMDSGITPDSGNYLRNSFMSLLQIIIGVTAIFLLNKTSQNRTGEKIAFIIRTHQFYKMSLSAIESMVISFSVLFNRWYRQIAYMLNVETFREIYSTGIFFKRAHKNCFQNHISWILFGIAVCLTFCFIERILD